ncbi:MAG: hypothetical protein J0H79_07480 [Alphaproteobacteria bacterium]|nr:hypothetical protein [Alphaproteobacteria bacterium]
MTLVLQTPPDGPVVTFPEMQAHLRQEDASELLSIGMYVDAATRNLDGRDGFLGRCLLTQIWKLKLDWFPPSIAVPLPPCQSVESITYVDAAGQDQTLAAETYQVAGIGTPDGARIVPAFGKSWPVTRRSLEAVTVTFKAGYGDHAEDVPEPIRTAIKMQAASLYENRESVLVGGDSIIDLSQPVLDLISGYRTWSF